MTSTTRNTGSAAAQWRPDILHVALVGNPKCGKSTIAEMMAEEFGGVVIDDGEILRKAIPILTGIPQEWCYTQEGKVQTVRVGERDEIVRQALGELGNWMEGRYGTHIMPLRAMELSSERHPDAPFYIYPSCRKDQGWAYRKQGGLVIEIANPRAKPTGNAFDLWDEDCVDMVLYNNPDHGLDALREEVRGLPARLLTIRR